MPQLIKPNLVVTTSEGECKIHISLDLNININGVPANVEGVKKEEEESTEWVIPSFNSSEKVSFGKKG